MKYPSFLVLILLASFSLQAQNSTDILGIWEHPDGKFLVKIDRIGNTYQGRITWLAHAEDRDGKPLLDINNPDPRLKKIPLKGNRILQQLTFDPSKNIWENGLYYVFSEGKTYPCKIVLLDDERIKISKFIPGSTTVEEEIWIRHH